MVKSTSIFFSTLFIIASTLVRAQHISKVELASICNEVEALLGNDWFLTPTASGFTVTFCRSCHKAYIDSFYTTFDEEGLRFPEPREHFFIIDRADSISYYPSCCHPVPEFRASDSLGHIERLKAYNADGILSFEIIFKPKWSEKKYSNVLSNNELLKDEILKEPLYKTNLNVFFADYRFFIPDTNLRARTQRFDFYFERLPYSSDFLDYSIFITHGKPYGSKLVYVDKSDPMYYKSESNNIESEYRRTLKIIALALGIKDYEVLF